MVNLGCATKRTTDFWRRCTVDVVVVVVDVLVVVVEVLVISALKIIPKWNSLDHETTTQQGGMI